MPYRDSGILIKTFSQDWSWFIKKWRETGSMTHWQPSIRIEKVPSPVQGDFAKEHINEIDYESNISKIIIVQ